MKLKSHFSFILATGLGILLAGCGGNPNKVIAQKSPSALSSIPAVDGSSLESNPVPTVSVTANSNGREASVPTVEAKAGGTKIPVPTVDASVNPDPYTETTILGCSSSRSDLGDFAQNLAEEQQAEQALSQGDSIAWEQWYYADLDKPNPIYNLTEPGCVGPAYQPVSDFFKSISQYIINNEYYRQASVGTTAQSKYQCTTNIPGDVWRQKALWGETLGKQADLPNKMIITINAGGISPQSAFTFRAMQFKDSLLSEEGVPSDTLNADGPDSHRIPPVTLKAVDLESKIQGVYTTTFSKIVPPNDWNGQGISTGIAITSADNPNSPSCVLTYDIVSPLVLDFSGNSILSTVPVSKSKAYFDLDNSGIAQHTGWVNGNNVAFLVLDLNNNGIIDNGSELFGEATRNKHGKRAFKDGFAALAQYDTKGKGVINHSSPIYSKLRLWFNKGGTGKTEAGELISLKEAGITSISLKPTAISHKLAFQHSSDIRPNDVRLSASFSTASGKCKKGCKIYDVFFGTEKSRLVARTIRP